MTMHLAIEEAAARWLVQRLDGDWSEADEREFDGWMNESYAHMAAFWRLEHSYEQLDRLASLPPSDLVEPRIHAPVRAMAGYFALAATILGIMVGGWLFLGISGNRAERAPTQTIAYSTEIGQISKIALADGSVVYLDSGTTLRVSAEPGERRVWLDRGRAFFEVKHDSNRPFVVDAGVGSIMDLGTSFVVDRKLNVIKTSVLEGSVRLGPAQLNPFSGVTLGRGDIAIATPTSVRSEHIDPRELENSLAWREGMAIFNNTPIEQAVAQFNEYNQRKMVVRQTGAVGTRISGKFLLGNIDGFARLMRRAYAIDINIVPATAGLSVGRDTNT